MIKNKIEKNQNIQPNSDLLSSLQSNYPNYFDKDGNFQLDKFQNDLKQNNISEAKFGHHLGFVGKDYARWQTGQESETIVVPDIKHNSKPENAQSENVFITGDNIEALRHLKNAYTGKIKMIYIDPPYNTGKEFTYNDKFEFSDEKLKSALGYSDEEIQRLKSIQGKNSHSAWLTFMDTRLRIAQKLLTDDGVIFVSIDENEFANLQLLMNDVFGESQFVALAPRKTGAGSAATNSEKELRKLNDYILVYAKNNFLFKRKIIGKKTYPFEDEHGKYNFGKYQASGSDSTRIARPNMYYPIYELEDGSLTTKKNEDKKIVRTILPEKVKGVDGRWMWKPEKFEKDKRKFIHFENGKIQRKIYLDQTKDQTKYQVEKAWFEKFPNSTATKRFDKLMGRKGLFSNPKPVDLIEFLMDLIDEREYYVLDFFAGSATTAESVYSLNAKDKGKRRFILVQLNEKTFKTNTEGKPILDKTDNLIPKEGAEIALLYGYKSIDEISRERIKRAAEKVKKENPIFAEQGDLGFKHYRLLEPPVTAIEKIMEFNPEIPELFGEDMISSFAYESTNTKGIDTILQTWLLQDGFDFSTIVERLTFETYEAYYVPEGTTLYFIQPEMNLPALKDFLNKIGKNELQVNTLIVYPYSFTFEELRQLKFNVKNNLDKNVNIIERY